MAIMKMPLSNTQKRISFNICLTGVPENRIECREILFKRDNR